MSDEYAAIFLEEATELLEELESALLELEETPDDLRIVGRVFRSMHTIKGSGAMFGFEEISDFTHHVETVLETVRDGSMPATKELIDLVLASRDHILSLLPDASGEKKTDSARGDELIEQLQGLLKSDKSSEAETSENEPELAETLDVPEEENESESLSIPELDFGLVSDTTKNADQYVYRISFKPSAEFFRNGGDVEAIFVELASLGEIIVTGQSDGTCEEFFENRKEAFWDLILTTSLGENPIRDAFIFAEEHSVIKIINIGSVDEDTFPERQRIGDILVDRGEVDREVLDTILKEQKPLGEMLVEKKLVCPHKVESALKEQAFLDKKRQMNVKATDSLRVAADKLDHLINLVGEMVVTQARLTQVSMGLEDSEVCNSVEEVERLTSELRDCVLNIRMLPIGTTFSRFKRLVRDLSSELGKEVEMFTEGAETELDKSVLEMMGDPLVHLIRNCIDHGIETPEARKAAGKPEKGTIRLTATHSGANVVIEVVDDGKGLDARLIRAKAIEKGQISADKDLTEAEIFRLIFGAGVSTASEITEVSGRGVGMDVVKNTIEGRLRGSVGVSSIKGEGTTISISLPLTLAIIDGLLVKVGEEYYVIPLSLVEECVELSQEDIDRFHGRHVFSVREQLVPYINLRQFFLVDGSAPDLQQMVIVNVNGKRFGLVLDYVVGSHQTVLKSLGWAYRNAEGVSGATILGSGEVALVVDVANLCKHACRDEEGVR